MSIDPGAHGANLEHRIGLYDTDAFLVSTVAAFVRDAFAVGAIVDVLLLPSHQQALSDLLTASGIDVDAAIERGRFVPVDAEELLRELMNGGRFDRSVYITAAEEQLRAARQQGRELHICGNLVSLLWGAGDIATVLALEGLVNELPAVQDLRLLCMYDASVFHGDGGPDHFLSVCRQHARVDPVEDYASLVGPDAPGWSVALLEQQERAHALTRRELDARRRAIEIELDQCLRDDQEQQSQLSRAFASRDVIGQAKGVLMVRYRIDAETAFETLRDASNRSQRKLSDVARAVVEQQRRRN